MDKAMNDKIVQVLRHLDSQKLTVDEAMEKLIFIIEDEG